jgi:hypothetical protein
MGLLCVVVVIVYIYRFLYIYFFVQYKTARSSELRALLARAREKAEDTGSHHDSDRSSGYGRQRPALQGIDPGRKPYTSSDNSSLGLEDDESDSK